MSSNNMIEKMAFSKALKTGINSAVLVGGISASSAYDKYKDENSASMTSLKTTAKATRDAGLGLAGGIAVSKGLGATKKGFSNIGNNIASVGKNIAKLKKYAEEEKTAGVMKAMAIPAVLGGVLSGEKANDVASDNPYLSDEDSKRYVNGKKMQGAAIGAGVGYGAYKLTKLPGNLVRGIAKKAEIKVPEKKELPEDEAVVKDSPNKEEINDMVEPITEESLQRNKYKDLIEKVSMESTDGYLKPIKCDGCGYKGLPKSDSGMCPECGALGGKISYPTSSVEHFDPDTKERNLTSVWEMAERTRQERLSYYR